MYELDQRESTANSTVHAANLDLITALPEEIPEHRARSEPSKKGKKIKMYELTWKFSKHIITQTKFYIMNLEFDVRWYQCGFWPCLSVSSVAFS